MSGVVIKLEDQTIYNFDKDSWISQGRFCCQEESGREGLLKTVNKVLNSLNLTQDITFYKVQLWQKIYMAGPK